MAEGLDGAEFDGRVAQLTREPTPAMMESAHDNALNMVLMGSPKYGGFQQKAVDLVNSNIILKIAMPFMQIGTNIINEGIIKSTPLAYASEAARNDLAGLNGDVARTTRIAQIGVGTGVMAAVMTATAEGVITGGGSPDPKQQALDKLAGISPYSIRIGDTYYPIRKYLGPLGILVAASSDMYESGHLLSEGELSKAGASLIFGLSEAVINESWMAGLSNFVNAMTHWDHGGERYLENLATSFIPFSSALNQAARNIDPYAREARNLLDLARSKIPVLSEDLRPRLDIFGRSMPSHTMLSPTEQTADPVILRMQALEHAGEQVYPAAPLRKINGVKLTDEQYHDYAQNAGMLAKMRLDAMVSSPGFEAMPDAMQAKVFKDTFMHSRDMAQKMIKMQDPNILAQAAMNKRAIFEKMTK